MASGGEELLFGPLGGVGEIGMNLAVYGFGCTPDAMCGVSCTIGVRPTWSAMLIGMSPIGLTA